MTGQENIFIFQKNLGNVLVRANKNQRKRFGQEFKSKGKGFRQVLKNQMEISVTTRKNLVNFP